MPTCLTDFTGWAGNILDSLDETGIPTGRVVTWLTSHLGTLNSALRTSFVLNESGCVTGDMTSAHSGIYTEMYFCYYYKKKANQNLGAAGYDWTTMTGDDQGTIKKVSKNEVAKTYRLMSQDCQDQLKKLITWYHSEYNPLEPRQIMYNTRVDVTQTAMISPPNSYYSPTNFVWETVTS